MNSQIREAAALWLVEFRTDSVDIAARRRFAAWLRQSPEHIKAYLNLVALWEDARLYDPQRRLNIDTLVALARADRVITDIRADARLNGDADTITPEAHESRAAIPRQTVLRRLLRPRTGIAAVLSLVMTCGPWWIAVHWRDGEYTTQIAEQRSVVLSDGSRVDLDALSNMRVKFTGDERTVELVSGQAIFRVTKDAKRPFIVHADGARVRAVGTQFDVNRTPLGAVLTVLEGGVAVRTSSGPSVDSFGSSSRSETTVHQLSAPGIGSKVEAGQQVTISRGTITIPQSVDTSAVTAWTRKLLIFTSTPLPVVAEEFNRFNSRQLAIASPELVDFHVTGTFRAFDPETLTNFVLLLRHQPGIEILEKGDQIIVRAHSHSSPGASLHM
jgi:transmembrane sensor